MKKLLFMLVVACSTAVAVAQNTRVIKGAVVDKNGNPLPGAVVEATNGAESTVVDADGTFSLEVPVWLKSITAKYAGMRDKKLSTNRNDHVFYMSKKTQGHWFANLSYGACLDGDATYYSRIGIMGGYYASWGAYARIMPSTVSGVPSFSVGVMKNIKNKVIPYLGLGLTEGLNYVSGYSSSYYNYYSNSYQTMWYDGYWYGEITGQVDIGALVNVSSKFHINVGYSINFELNHEFIVGVGYTF